MQDYSSEAKFKGPHCQCSILLSLSLPELNSGFISFGKTFPFQSSVKVNMFCFKSINEPQRLVRVGCSRSEEGKPEECGVWSLSQHIVYPHVCQSLRGYEEGVGNTRALNLSSLRTVTSTVY